MSYRTMMQHRCTVLRLQETAQNGYVTHEWVQLASSVPCFLDLNFIRRGKDPMWSPEAGRPGDHTGVLFALAATPVRSGDRVKMTKGPDGTYSVEGAVDPAWRPASLHHMELGVVEVAKSLLGEEQ